MANSHDEPENKLQDSNGTPMCDLRDELEKKLQDSNGTPMCLRLEFLKAITCNFSTESELGRGGYGVVYKVFHFLYPNFQLLVMVINERYMYIV